MCKGCKRGKYFMSRLSPKKEATAFTKGNSSNILEKMNNTTITKRSVLKKDSTNNASSNKFSRYTSNNTRNNFLSSYLSALLAQRIRCCQKAPHVSAPSAVTMA